MKKNSSQDTASSASGLNRRDFLKSSTAALGAAVGASTLSIERAAHAASSDLLKVALVGCGGRGSGAASQALSTYDQGPVQLVAMADVFQNQLNGSLNNLKRQHPDRVNVPESNQFLGFDGYKSAISLADVVILATPPGFRPMQFEEAVRQGKHVFTEKPVAVDGPGVRRFLAAAAEAKRKGLKVGVGLQRHHQLGYQETMKRIHDGAIGDIVAARAYWNGTPPWVKFRKKLEEDAGRKLTEMEYQMRNWYYFNWLCGDHIVEQHIHNLDVINWAKNAYPVRCHGMGGCEVRKGPDYGEIFDHHAVEYIYEDGSRMFSQCRHQVGTRADVSEHLTGTKGTCNVGGYTISLYENNPWLGGKAWRFRAEAKDPYQQEHDDLFSAIRNNKDFSEAENGAKSSLTSIMGRMATYSGKEVTWEAALNSTLDLMPESLAWDAQPKVLPGPDGLYPLAVPGRTVAL